MMSKHEKYTGKNRSKDSEEDDDKKEKKSIEQFNPPNPKASGLRRKKGLPRSQGDKKIQELKGFDDIPDSNETLYKEVQGILNKLTPQTFQTLLYKMKALPIDTERKLRGVVDLVFDKAVSEPKSSEVYANMCRCLSMFKCPSESKSDKMVNFRAALLTKSQREFEMDKSPKAWLITKRKETEKNGDRAENKELEEELMNEFCRKKQRYLGHMRFIGELFKLKMITENIMHDCVFKLLRTKDPEKLECLCVLLTTIGKELDVEQAMPRMDQYFQQMGKIVRQEETPSGLRIIMQDVMDLRTNGWVPLGNSPHAAGHMEKETTQTQQAQNTASTSQQRGGCRVKVPSLMSCVEGRNTQNVDEGATQFGPGGPAGRFSGWGRGSTNGTADKNSEKKKKSSVRATCGQSVGGSHREKYGERSEPESQASTSFQVAFTKHKEHSENEMEKKAKAILDEYLAVQDTKELESTRGGDSAPTTPTTGLSMTEIEGKLHELIVTDKADNETVFDWIEGNVDDPTTKGAKFIRALTTAVCETALEGENGNERLEPKEICARNDLLQKYLDHQADSELQALYAVQALIAKLGHPQGVLRVMFDTLYDEDIISEDAFFQWERSEEEPEGKFGCLKQVIQFFTWLKEAEEDSLIFNI